MKKILPLVLGTAGGFAYWYFIGCLSGTCPITSNWYTSTIYGAVVGATFLIPTKKKIVPKAVDSDAAASSGGTSSNASAKSADTAETDAAEEK